MSFNRIIIFLLLIATPLFSQYKLKKSVYGGICDSKRYTDFSFSFRESTLSIDSLNAISFIIKCALGLFLYKFLPINYPIFVFDLQKVSASS